MEVKVDIEILERQFSDFLQLIESQDKKPFERFKGSQFIENEENYKYSVHKEAKKKLGQKRWKKEDIGTGKIREAVESAIELKVYHNGKIVDNNLVYWRQKGNFSKKTESKTREIENTLFHFYKNKIKDSQAFQSLLDKGLPYQLIAYLFFIKDREKFMPISQERFDDIFELIGIPEFKTSRNASWENYSTFNDIIKQVHQFLLTKNKEATLLDAHSFLWTLGRIDKGHFTSSTSQ